MNCHSIVQAGWQSNC